MIDLAVDLGSEFVDVALRQGSHCSVAKFPVAGRCDEEAILASLDGALQGWDVPLEAVKHLRVGSTGTVNALLARRGARVGLLTTRGFADTLYLGRQNRAELYEPVARSPSPAFLIRPEDVAEVDGRIDAAGNEEQPLDVEAVSAASTRFRQSMVESVAVCLLFAHVNPAHEKRCAAILAEALPGVEICTSHQVDGNAREYERTVSASLEAWLRPSSKRAIRCIEEGLASRGFAGRLSFAESRGGLIGAGTASNHALSLIASGPAMSAKAAAAVANALGAPRAIALDIGSTSTDFGLIEQGEPRATVGTSFAGVPLRLAMVDVESVSLGGSSRVVSHESGGISFEARPSGGEALTLGDALFQLGWVPSNDAHGAAERMGRFARERAMQPTKAATLIVHAAEIRTAEALLRHAVRRNVDPASLPLVAMGGLGGILALGVAERLGMSEVALPSAPAAGGALGLLLAEELLEAEANVNAAPEDIGEDALRSLAARLVEEARAGASDTGAPGGLTPSFVASIAANRHMHSMVTPLGTSVPTVRLLAEMFAAHHRREYGIPPRGRGFVFALAVRLVSAAAAHPILPEPQAADPSSGTEPGEPISTAAGTILLRPGWSAGRTAQGCWLLKREGNGDPR